MHASPHKTCQVFIVIIFLFFQENGNKPEALKRRFESPPSTSKRSRTDVTK